MMLNGDATFRLRHGLQRCLFNDALYDTIPT